jgi:hypothetical protein
MPQHFSEDERTNPLAWAFQCDSAGHNSFTKLMRYEGFLQREFSRSLRDLFKMQDERRAREAEAKPQRAAPPPPPPPPTPPPPPPPLDPLTPLKRRGACPAPWPAGARRASARR